MNNADNQSKPEASHPRLIIIVLILIFSAPLLSSWFIFNYTSLVDNQGAQHGDMYEPLVKLSDVPLRNPYSEQQGDASLYGKWSLLYMNSGECDKDCQYNIYSMRQIRLALSRYARNLQRVWMTDIQDSAALRAALEKYQGTLVLDSTTAAGKIKPADFAMPPVDAPLENDALYVIDPKGYLVLRYRAGVDPEGIISDLKRLLKTSTID